MQSKDAATKGKLQLQHALGLGHQPNVIPQQEAKILSELREVHIGWHPVGGFSGKWFAEKTGLGKKITEKINHYPDPTQHWAVLVGEYAHELWMVWAWLSTFKVCVTETVMQDEHLDVIYINEKVKREDWHTFEVGKTNFNDEALRQTGMSHFNDRFHI